MRARSFLESENYIFLPIIDIHSTQSYVDYLQGSTFLGDLDNIVECFDRSTKLRFRNSDEYQYIKFGGAKDNDQLVSRRQSSIYVTCPTDHDI